MLGRAIGLALPWWVKWAAIGGLMLASAVCGGWWMHIFSQAQYDNLAHEFAMFDAKVSSEGREALQRAAMQASNDLKRKETADADLKSARRAAADANAGWLRLAQSRAGGGYLPAVAANSASPDRACVDRAEFERAMGELDKSGAGIAAQGDSCRLEIDTARRWAANQQ